MKTIKLIIALMAIYTGSQAQDFVREIDKKTDKVCLRGLITFDDIKKETAFSWFQKNADSYKPNKETILALTTVLKPYRLVVFGGTWCGDTQDLFPQFYKTMQLAQFDFNALQLYAVNRNKEAINIESQLYNITKVPTFIVMEGFREVGRITETVHKSIEEDLLQILEMDMQKKRD